MDPNLFHLDWERTWEALVLIMILAFIIERALAVIFENKLWLSRFDRPGLKELIAAGVSIWVWKFDALGMIILTERTTVPGYLLTGLVVAGGSKASIKLFHDVLDIKSSTVRKLDAVKEAETRAEVAATVSESRPPTVTIVTPDPKAPPADPQGPQ